METVSFFRDFSRRYYFSMILFHETISTNYKMSHQVIKAFLPYRYLKYLTRTINIFIRRKYRAWEVNQITPIPLVFLTFGSISPTNIAFSWLILMNCKMKLFFHFFYYSMDTDVDSFRSSLHFTAIARTI